MLAGAVLLCRPQHHAVCPRSTGRPRTWKHVLLRWIRVITADCQVSCFQGSFALWKRRRRRRGSQRRLPLLLTAPRRSPPAVARSAAPAARPTPAVKQPKRRRRCGRPQSFCLPASPHFATSAMSLDLRSTFRCCRRSERRWGVHAARDMVQPHAVGPYFFEMMGWVMRVCVSRPRRSFN